jgi:hypothetical protein
MHALFLCSHRVAQESLLFATTAVPRLKYASFQFWGKEGRIPRHAAEPEIYKLIIYFITAHFR